MGSAGAQTADRERMVSHKAAGAEVEAREESSSSHASRFILAWAEYSWSKNSRYLLTASKDCSCVIWDLDTGDRRETIRFDSAVTEATFHPHNS